MFVLLFYDCHLINVSQCFSLFFFFNDTATTEIYTLSLHDALPISRRIASDPALGGTRVVMLTTFDLDEYVFEALHEIGRAPRLNSSHRQYLVCRLLLEKKKKENKNAVDI